MRGPRNACPTTGLTSCRTTEAVGPNGIGASSPGMPESPPSPFPSTCSAPCKRIWIPSRRRTRCTTRRAFLHHLRNVVTALSPTNRQGPRRMSGSGYIATWVRAAIGATICGGDSPPSGRLLPRDGRSGTLALGRPAMSAAPLKGDQGKGPRDLRAAWRVVPRAREADRASKARGPDLARSGGSPRFAEQLPTGRDSLAACAAPRPL